MMGLTRQNSEFCRFQASRAIRAIPIALVVIAAVAAVGAGPAVADEFVVEETETLLSLQTDALKAAIAKSGYVTGIKALSFVDRKTGFRDPGYGLDIVDWIMEPGSDVEYRDQLEPEMVYEVGNLYHGKTLKRSIEGPQICTQAKTMSPTLLRGSNFLAVTESFQYRTAAPGKKTGSKWTQTIVIPQGARYFVSCDRIETVNSSPAMFLRLDLPGHIKHNKGDTFSEIYLSYVGRIPSSEFTTDFAPDEKFNYTRGRDPVPERFIRAYRLRDPQTGTDGPWLAGMTLQPDVVSESWCHQRGYVCMIQEFGGRPAKPGDVIQAAFIVGYFDSIEEMHATYDKYAGHTSLSVSAEGWKLEK